MIYLDNVPVIVGNDLSRWILAELVQVQCACCGDGSFILLTPGEAVPALYCEECQIC